MSLVPVAGANGKRIAAFALLLVLIILTILSEAFILTRLNHEHDRDGVDAGCAVCDRMQNAVERQRQFNASGGAVPFAFAGLFIAVMVFIFVASQMNSHTLINLKVRMDN